MTRVEEEVAIQEVDIEVVVVEDAIKIEEKGTLNHMKNLRTPMIEEPIVAIEGFLVVEEVD